MYNKNKQKAQKEYKKMLLVNAPLRDKISSGSKCSSKALKEMSARFYSENAGAIALAREEQIALKKKKISICHCGKPKGCSFTECYECNLARKKVSF